MGVMWEWDYIRIFSEPFFICIVDRLRDEVREESSGIQSR